MEEGHFISIYKKDIESYWNRSQLMYSIFFFLHPYLLFLKISKGIECVHNESIYLTLLLPNAFHPSNLHIKDN